MSINFTFLDELPNDWKTARVKNILDYNHHYPIGDGDHGSIKPEMYQDEGIPYLRVQNLSWGFDINYDNLVYISDEVNQANSKSILMPDDILIAKTGTVGKMAIIPESMKQANTTSSVGKITINQKIFNNRYFAYLFSSPMFQEQIKEIAYQKSAQPGFNIDDLIEFNIIIPPRDIQNKIANHLDKETTKIDLTIAKNEELIKLLSEKRVALINQVVTKGLNPDVPMKDSGVEWIGEIPEHYSIIKLKFLTSKIGSGKTPKGGSEIYVSEGIPLLRSQNIHFDSIRLDDVVYITEEINQTMLSTVVKNKDILFNITGASIGRCNYIEDINIANVNQHVCIIRPNKKIFYKYLNYFLQSDCGQNQVFLNQNGTSREGLNFEDLSNFYIILPKDIKEQKTVVSYLEKEIIKIYTTINKVKENIRLLEEYKTSLIHHVVTGKIDVRGEEI